MHTQTQLRVLSLSLLCAAQAALVGTTQAQSTSPFERSVTGSQGFWQRYTLEIPAGSTSLDVTLSGGTGDADLYVRFGEQPNDASYDCRSNAVGNEDACSVPAPSAGTWHIAVAGYTAFSDVNVKATWGAASAPEVDWKKPVLDRHNVVRAQHCAVPLTWDAELEAAAQTYANRCIWDHDGETPFGENMAYRSLKESALTTIDSWYGELARYDFARPGFSLQTGHFTQVVWNSSTRLGCARAQCALSTLTKNPAAQGDVNLYICRYADRGNTTGAFPANVKPKSESGTCE